MSTISSSSTSYAFSANSPSVSNVRVATTNDNGETVTRPLDLTDRVELSPEATAYANMPLEDFFTGVTSTNDGELIARAGKRPDNGFTMTMTVDSNPQFQRDYLREWQVFLGIAKPNADETQYLNREALKKPEYQSAEYKQQMIQAQELSKTVSQTQESTLQKKIQEHAVEIVDYLAEKTGEKASKMNLAFDKAGNIKISFTGKGWLSDFYSQSYEKAIAEDLDFANLMKMFSSSVEAMNPKKLAMTIDLF
ncbi:MAG: hypothetical protein ACRC10_09135 [Thermoguttaceae bacterium]